MTHPQVLARNNMTHPQVLAGNNMTHPQVLAGNNMTQQRFCDLLAAFSTRSKYRVNATTFL